MIIDLHTHTTPFSDDSALQPAELIKKSKEAGLDGICLTEHDWFWDQSEIDDLSRRYDFLVLPGVEINTDDGHVLAFGLDHYSFGIFHPEVLKRVIDDAGGAMILAHPYRRRFYADQDIQIAVEKHYHTAIFEMVDAIEVINGKASPKQNRFSQELIHRRLNLRGVGGSDAHFAADIGSSATIFENTIKTLNDLVTELKAGRFMPIDLRRQHRLSHQ